MSGARAFALLPGAALILIVARLLSRSGYSAGAVWLLVALAAVQAGPTRIVMEPGHSLWLALAMAAVAASASAFAKRDDARRVILLSGSLAAVQVADPMGGLLAAGLVPAAVVLGFRHGAPRARAELRRSRTLVHRDDSAGASDAPGAGGLCALLLFLPVATAGALFYVSRALHVSPWEAAGAAAPPRQTGFGMGMLIAASPALAAAPALLGAARSEGGRAIAVVAAVAAVSAAFAALNGAIREPLTLLAVAAPLALVAVAELPEEPGRTRRAVVTAALCTALSWLVPVFESG